MNLKDLKGKHVLLFVEEFVVVLKELFVVGLPVFVVCLGFVIVSLFVVVVVFVVVVHFSLPETSPNVPGLISRGTSLYSGCLQQISPSQKHLASRGPRSVLRFFLPVGGPFCK